MTVREFVKLTEERPDILDLVLGHSPFNGTELPIEGKQVYLDTTDKGKRCVCVSGGGYPIRLNMECKLR